MKILSIDSKCRTLRLKIESEDDLWALYNVIDTGDIIVAKTTRELKTRSGSRRKPMTLMIKAEWSEFQPFTTRLRVHGKILEGPKELDLEGRRHTVNVDIGFDLTITKEDGWGELDLRRMEEACRKSHVKLLAVGVDDEEAFIAFVRDYGIEPMAEIALNLPGKLYGDRFQELKGRLGEIAGTVADACMKLGIEVVVLAGPGHIKLLLQEVLEGRLPKHIRIYHESTSMGGYKGVHEAIKRGIITRILSDYDLIVEERLIDEFMEMLSRSDRMVAYGINDVAMAVSAGAVEKLMVASDLVRSPDGELRRRIEEIVREAESRGAKVKIFSSIHETRLKLKHLGGMAAILRYDFRGSMDVPH